MVLIASLFTHPATATRAARHAAALGTALGAALALAACAPAATTSTPAPVPTPVASVAPTTSVAEPRRTVTERSGEVDRGATLRAITLDELTATPVAAPASARGFASNAVRTGATRATQATSTARVATSTSGANDRSTGDRGTTLWRGTYEGGTYGRRGALALLLDASPAGFDGGVVAWRAAPATAAAFGRSPATRRSDAPLLVRTSVVSGTREGSRVVLRLDAFFDPACNCTAQATFRGLVRGDTLTGRFSLDGAATVVGEERGRWRAVRVTTGP